MINFLIAARRHFLRIVHPRPDYLRLLPRVRALHHRPGAPVQGVRALRQSGAHPRSNRACICSGSSSAGKPRSSTGSAAATCWTCVWTRNTSAASRSIPRKARPWASASGTRCSSATRSSYLFKNADPRGSLAANVSNSTVRCLSNLKLGDMLENRHAMSQTVRAEVSPKSHEWGYQLGSVYIRKVHFRDAGMIKQIEEKVVNRLRQVTSAIKQDGANQVSIITSTAERQAAIEFAKAAAMRPRIVGAGLQEIARDPEIAQAMFEVWKRRRSSKARRISSWCRPDKKCSSSCLPSGW